RPTACSGTTRSTTGSRSTCASKHAMPTPTDGALITNDAVVLGLLAITLGAIFWTSSRPSGFWHRFYSYVPALLMCYLVPAIYNSLGLVDGNASGLYPMARDYLLPSSLV